MAWSAKALRREKGSARPASDPIPLLAALAVGQLVGLVVVNELFLLRIEIEFASEFVPDIAKLAKGGGSVSGLDVSEGEFARVDAVEPLVVVASWLAYAHGCLVILE